jgi:hypothetical protein
MIDVGIAGRPWAGARYESDGNLSRTAAYKTPNRTSRPNRSTIAHMWEGCGRSCGRRVGWKPTCIGDWNHPINQMMMRFEAT